MLFCAAWSGVIFDERDIMIELGDDKTLFFFDRDLEPVLRVPSGETVRIRTKDCFSNQLQGPEDQMNDIDWDAVNPATGPIFVEGAKAGGALIFMVPETRWWAQSVSFGGKTDKKIGRLPDAKIYKARFFVPSTF